MSASQHRFALPLPGQPIVELIPAADFSSAELHFDDGTSQQLSGNRLRGGVLVSLPAGLATHASPAGLRVSWNGDEDRLAFEVVVDGRPALLMEGMRAKPSRSAWLHAWLALFASFAGFVASYLYLLKANAIGSAWAGKMAYHTAFWHALLTVTLFPASVWGQRAGIRAVQFVSFVFFCIHLGIAVANAFWPDPNSLQDAAIAIFNALSGAFFLASVLYGQRAHRDMDPVAALRDERI